MNKRKFLVTFGSLFIVFILIYPALGNTYGHNKFKYTANHADIRHTVGGTEVFDGSFGLSAWLTNSRPTSGLEGGILQMNLDANYPRWYYEMNVAVQPWNDGSKPFGTASKIEYLSVILRVYDETAGSYISGWDLFFSNSNYIFKVESDGDNGMSSMMADLVSDMSGATGNIIDVFGAGIDNDNPFDDGSDTGYIWSSQTPGWKFPDALYFTAKADLNAWTFDKTHTFRFEYSVYIEVSGMGWKNYITSRTLEFSHYIDNSDYSPPSNPYCPPIC